VEKNLNGKSLQENSITTIHNPVNWDKCLYTKDYKWLKSNYSSVYTENGIVFKQLLRNGAVKNLPKVVNDSTAYLEKIKEIESQITRKIVAQTEQGSKWKRSVKPELN